VTTFGLMLGAALGIRVLGLLLVGYAAFAISARLMQRRDTPRGQLQFFADSAISVAPAFLIGYAIMLLAWPWSGLSPLNPIRGLIDFGHFHYQISTLLDGHGAALVRSSLSADPAAADRAHRHSARAGIVDMAQLPHGWRTA
jgi:hypothetical protein